MQALQLDALGTEVPRLAAMRGGVLLGVALLSSACAGRLRQQAGILVLSKTPVSAGPWLPRQRRP